jgi:hypothetical protein
MMSELIFFSIIGRFEYKICIERTNEDERFPLLILLIWKKSAILTTLQFGMSLTLPKWRENPRSQGDGRIQSICHMNGNYEQYG